MDISKEIEKAIKELKSQGVKYPKMNTQDVIDMLGRLNGLVKESDSLPCVRLSLEDFPENMPLYKDSGLWQLRSDDMEEVILQQEVNQTDLEFLDMCRYFSEA